MPLDSWAQNLGPRYKSFNRTKAIYGVNLYRCLNAVSMRLNYLRIDFNRFLFCSVGQLESYSQSIILPVKRWDYTNWGFAIEHIYLSQECWRENCLNRQMFLRSVSDFVLSTEVTWHVYESQTQRAKAAVHNSFSYLSVFVLSKEKQAKQMPHACSRFFGICHCKFMSFVPSPCSLLLT